ncbi:MAG: gliding motility-associated C-terminal domain-containing protein [Bacteroidota bacterium]
MEEKDYIKDLFSEKLGNHSVQVNPELWSAIASKLPATTVVSSGISLTSKVLIGLGTAASITIATILLTNEKDVVKKVEKTVKTNKGISENKLNQVKDNSSIEELNTINTSSQSDNSVIAKVENSNNSLLEENKTNSTTIISNVYPFETKVEEPKIEKRIINNVNPIVEEKKTSTSSVSENEPKIITETKSDLVIGDLPNIFTPNNDKENDLFTIEIKGLSDFSISILNSENKAVFTSTDPNFKWDGKDFSENLVPTGNYFYFFTGLDSNKKAVSKSNMLKVHY